MKAMFRVVTITAVLIGAAAIKTFAQDEPAAPPAPPEPPAPPVVIMHDVQNVAEGAVHKAQADIENHMQQMQTQLKKIKDNVFMSRRGKDKSLVVRSSAMEPRAQGDLEEDMTIMTHILDKAVAERSSDDQYGHPVAMGINVSFVPGEGPTRSIYVDGYGALFFLNVNFPLLPPPMEKNVDKENTSKDSTWEEARDEVYGHSAKAWNPGPQVEYDAAKVTSLTNALLDALKNASNIRNVRSDESITICVIGAPLRTLVVREVLRSGGGGGGASGFGGGGGSAGATGGGSESGSSDYDRAQRDFERAMRNYDRNNDDAPGNRTTLTIRAKKADCVAYANGRLTTEEFRKRAVITIYGDSADKP